MNFRVTVDLNEVLTIGRTGEAAHLDRSHVTVDRSAHDRSVAVLVIRLDIRALFKQLSHLPPPTGERAYHRGASGYILARGPITGEPARIYLPGDQL
eukprot:2384235-Pyramimonas_sp.AAC.1